VLVFVGGIDDRLLDCRGHACPKCGGTDRFALIDKAAGAVHCRNCFHERNGDGLAAIMWAQNCSFPEAIRLVAAHLGLTADRPSRGSGNGHPAKPANKTFPTAREAIAALERRHGPRSAEWVYHHADGEPVGVVIRWNTPNGKSIRPLARRPDGTWTIGGMPAPRPLYLLDSLGTSGRVWVTEGEKTCDAARSIGLLSTTSAGGSGAASKTDWTPLAGREIIILADNDIPGRKYARAVAGILSKLTPAPVVKVVVLPGLPEHGDAYDFIEAGRAAGRADADLLREIEALAEAAAEWAPTAVVKSGPVLVCLSDVEPREVEWLWPGRIPLGRITLVAGRPGVGKSFLTLDAAARVSTGTPWVDGSPCPQGSALLISAEDDPADTIRPRLDAHRADVSRVHLLSSVRKVDNDGHYERLLTLTDVDAIETALERLSDCKLVVVDPVGNFLGGRTDAHRDNEVRGVLAPVAQLAEKHNVAVAVVAHTRKAGGNVADDLVLGSRAFTGIARAVWHLSRDPENKARRLLLPGKANLSCEADGLAFSIVGDPPHVSWERDPVEMSADDALAAENRDRRRGPEAETLNSASAWLRSALVGGPRSAKDLLDEWKNGQGGSKRSLERAKQSIGAEAYRPENPGPWWWRLPDNGGRPPEDKQPGGLGGVLKTPGKTTFFEGDNVHTAKLNDPGGVLCERVRTVL